MSLAKKLTLFLVATLVILGLPGLPAAQVIRLGTGDDLGLINKVGFDFDIRSEGRIIADEVAQVGSLASADVVGAVPGVSVTPKIRFRGGNIQVNDAALDNIQIFAGTRPFVKFIQSETSIAVHGGNIVAGYNSSANQPVVQIGADLFFTRRFFSGFSTSNDGGRTWTSGFVPPVPGSIFTFGDPVVGADRRGVFFYAGLGTDAFGNGTVNINISNDRGRTWSPGIVVQVDDGSDKEWLAVGPDPMEKGRDNVYVTWTSFQSAPSRSELRFARSIDGGLTWAAKTIFAPTANADPTRPQQFIQFSVPFVDPVTGRLYVPFLHFSNSDEDFIRIMVSNDAGETFSFLNFNVAGAPDAAALPVVSAGELIDCGNPGGGVRLVIKSGTNLGGGRFGLRRFRNATRLVTQPAFAAHDGVLYLGWSNSTSGIFGAQNSNSNILFMRSSDGGGTWTGPLQVNPNVSTNSHHVLPSLTIGKKPEDVHIAYYVQHSNGTVSVHLANSQDGGFSFPVNRTVQVTSTAFALAPTNNPIPTAAQPFRTTNYDRTVRACYSLGEYLDVESAGGQLFGLWGDLRNSVTEPVNALNPLSGQTHSQQDVFFQIVRAR